MDELDRNLYLYAKGWYKKEDLATLLLSESAIKELSC